MHSHHPGWTSCNSLLYGITDWLLTTYSQVRMLQHIWSLEHKGEIISRQRYTSYTGCQFERIKCKIACLVFQLLSGQASCHWITPISSYKNMYCPANTQTVWRQQLLCFQSSSVEHSTKWPTKIWNKFSKPFCSETMAHCDLLIYALLNTFTYLLT
jgi:hypothetical protein